MNNVTDDKTLVSVWEGLSFADKNFLLAFVQHYTPRGENFPMALLPFVPLKELFVRIEGFDIVGILHWNTNYGPSPILTGATVIARLKAATEILKETHT